MITAFNHEIVTPELIQELKEKKIINKYGELSFTELKEEYGLDIARTIRENITLEDIYNTFSNNELFNISIDIANLLRYKLINHELPDRGYVVELYAILLVLGRR